MKENNFIHYIRRDNHDTIQYDWFIIILLFTAIYLLASVKKNKSKWEQLRKIKWNLLK